MPGAGRPPWAPFLGAARRGDAIPQRRPRAAAEGGTRGGGRAAAGSGSGRRGAAADAFLSARGALPHGRRRPGVGPRLVVTRATAPAERSPPNGAAVRRGAALRSDLSRRSRLGDTCGHLAQSRCARAGGGRRSACCCILPLPSPEPPVPGSAAARGLGSGVIVSCKSLSRRLSHGAPGFYYNTVFAVPAQGWMYLMH